MKSFALGFFAVALFAGSTFAAQISGGIQAAGPNDFDYGDGNGDPSVPLSFSQFTACNGCTLTGIEFDISGTVVDNYTVTNTNSGTKNFTVNTSGFLQIITGDPSAVPSTAVTFGETIPLHSKSVSVTGTNCNPVNNPGCNSVSGTDTATGSGGAIYSISADGTTGTLSSVSGTAVNTDLSSPIDATIFQGTGTVTLYVQGLFNSTVAGSGNNSTTGGNGSETVQILYDYTAPEPGTMVLFGSALLGVGFFARKRVKQ